MVHVIRDIETSRVFTTTQLPPVLYPYGPLQLVYENATPEDIENYDKTHLARVLHQNRNRDSDEVNV
jgi:hypothetical protein